jgi:hypothetical protein
LLPFSAMKSVIFATTASWAAAEVGTKIVCLGPNAHLISYDIQGGESLETAASADIQIDRSAENDGMCVSNGEEDDQLFCFGANTDATCSKAAGSLPLTENFECNNCWAGVTADLYYKLSTVLGVPTKIEVGVRNTHIAGAMQIRAHGDSATELTSGSLDLPAPETHINFMAGTIPLNFTISLPTRIDYNLGLKGQLDATAGAVLDIDFGDHAAIVTPTTVDQINTNSTMTYDSILNVDAGDSGADMGVALAGAIKVAVSDMVDYHVDFSAGAPSKIKLENDVTTGLPAQLCFEGDVDIPVTHEALIYKTVFGARVPLYHYGPEEISHTYAEKALFKCSNLRASTLVV